MKHYTSIRHGSKTILPMPDNIIYDSEKIIIPGDKYRPARKGVHRQDLTNQTFGKLKVLRLNHVVIKGKSYDYYYDCQCECGRYTQVSSDHLIRGHITSCGCVLTKTLVKRNKTHGKSHSRLFGIWQGMVSRCYCETSPAYQHYGGRGVYISDDWYTPNQSGNPGFVNFYNWALQNGYTKTLTIDRIDVNGPYAPWNCRWVTRKTQLYNKRDSRTIEINGIRYSLSGILAALYAPDPVPKILYSKLGHAWSPYAVLAIALDPTLKLYTANHGQYYNNGFVYLLNRDKITTELVKRLEGVDYDFARCSTIP